MRIAIARAHSVTEGLAPFPIHDETYKRMWIAPTNSVLLTTDNPTADGPVAWVSAYAKARVVYIQLGHDANYRRLVMNAIRWTAAR